MVPAAGVVVLVGVIVFAADLSVRHLGAPRLFPSAAPLGGFLMIAGWLGLAISALFAQQPRP